MFPSRNKETIMRFFFLVEKKLPYLKLFKQWYPCPNFETSLNILMTLDVSMRWVTHVCKARFTLDILLVE